MLTPFIFLFRFSQQPPSVIFRPQSKGSEKNTGIKTGGSSHSMCQSHPSGPRPYRGDQTEEGQMKGRRRKEMKREAQVCIEGRKLRRKRNEVGTGQTHREGRREESRKEKGKPQPVTSLWWVWTKNWLVQLFKQGCYVQCLPTPCPKSWFLLPVLLGFVRKARCPSDPSKHPGGLGGAVRAELPAKGLCPGLVSRAKAGGCGGSPAVQCKGGPGNKRKTSLTCGWQWDLAHFKEAMNCTITQSSLSKPLCLIICMKTPDLVHI